MANSLKTFTLGELCTMKYGKMPKKEDLVESGYPVFSGYRVVGFHKQFLYEKPEIIVVARGVGGCGDIKISPPNCYLTNLSIALQIAKPNEVDKKFLYYRLSYTTLKGLNTGAAQPQITIADLQNYRVNLPPLKTQRKIASILSAYDDLIGNNTRRIKIFEEMAQALYREWFVNFCFPGHEHVKMVDSPLGMVPEGWTVVTLKDIVNNCREGTTAGEHLSEREYVPIDCLARKSLALQESNSWTEAQSSLILFRKNDILFGAMRSYFHKVTIAPIDGVTRSTCFVLRPKTAEMYSYAVLTANREETVAYASAHSRGATIPYAVWDGSLAEMKVLLPPSSLLKMFDSAIRPMLTLIRSSFLTQRNLRQTRDLLLPKLISGEVEVAEFIGIV